MRNNRSLAFRIAASALTVVSMLPNIAFAASNSDFSQTINPGTLATDIRDATRVTVASPSVAMSAVTTSFDCAALSGAPSTGTFGTNTQRIYVDNPSATSDGHWVLSLAATDGPTALWHNVGNTKSFDFNDAGTFGCTDTDSDTYAGQMRFDPSAGTVTADYTGGSTTGVSKGSAASFDEGVLDDITLLSADNTAAQVGRWYLTGVGIKQSIPANQPADSYLINLTLSVVSA